MSQHRVPPGGYGDVIGEALGRLPGAIRHRLDHVSFVCGVDPIFAGLHRYESSTDGRSYRAMAHCCYASHLRLPRDRRTTTIVIPVLAAPSMVVHELGHALDEVSGFAHVAAPVTDYARTNRMEAFAEAFVAWTHFYGDQDVAAQDGATRALFCELAR